MCEYCADTCEKRVVLEVSSSDDVDGESSTSTDSNNEESSVELKGKRPRLYFISELNLKRPAPHDIVLIIIISIDYHSLQLKC